MLCFWFSNVLSNTEPILKITLVIGFSNVQDLTTINSEKSSNNTTFTIDHLAYTYTQTELTAIFTACSGLPMVE